MSRSVACPAPHHANNLGIIFGAIGMGAANAAVNGTMVVRQAREASASQTLAFQLRQAVDSAHNWADVAKKHAVENERLKIEIERLKRIARDQHNELVAFARSAK
ncbi:MAG: hypothetical protein KL863_05165 [Rhizobium sp.]|nr:hypothetical protein [Rhizobium sp.]